jgi:putative copper export protein
MVWEDIVGSVLGAKFVLKENANVYQIVKEKSAGMMDVVEAVVNVLSLLIHIAPLKESAIARLIVKEKSAGMMDVVEVVACVFLLVLVYMNAFPEFVKR